MHALTARAIRIHLGPAGARDRMRDRALAILTSVIETSQGGDSLQELLAHLPHVEAVVGLMAGGDGRTLTADDRHLVNETGRVQVEYGETNAAVDSFAALYTACLASSAVDAVTRLSVLLGWATALGLAGQSTRALELKQQVVDGLGQLAEEMRTPVAPNVFNHVERSARFLPFETRPGSTPDSQRPQHRDNPS